MNRGLLLWLVVGSVLGSSMLMAQDAPKERVQYKDKMTGELKERPPALPVQDLTLSGKIVREEYQTKGGATAARYILADATGIQVSLPAPRGKKGAEAAAVINLDDYLNVDVKVVAKGVQQEMKGRNVTIVHEIVSIEKLAAPAL